MRFSKRLQRRYQGGPIAIHSWHCCGLLRREGGRIGFNKSYPKRALRVTMRTIGDTKAIACNSTSDQFISDVLQFSVQTMAYPCIYIQVSSG